MTTGPANGTTPPQSAAVDTALRCPQCEYNLTGLAEPRCPECGARFDWEELRRGGRPRIAFERARGWLKGPAFVLTWLTVLFAPWIFAGQAVRRVSVLHGLVFGIICFVPVTVRYGLEGFDPTFFAWISAAAIYVLLQAALFIGLDPHGWRQPWATFRFWLAIGGYTSAIAATEYISAAPLMSVSDVWDELRDFATGQLSIGDLYDLVDAERGWVGWLQLALWLAGVTCCYVARSRRRRLPATLVIPLAVLCVLLLVALYAFCVDPIGTGLWSLYGGSIAF
jgi:hypothetical protein